MCMYTYIYIYIFSQTLPTPRCKRSDNQHADDYAYTRTTQLPYKVPPQKDQKALDRGTVGGPRAIHIHSFIHLFIHSFVHIYIYYITLSSLRFRTYICIHTFRVCMLACVYTYIHILLLKTHLHMSKCFHTETSFSM